MWAALVAAGMLVAVNVASPPAEALPTAHHARQPSAVLAMWPGLRSATAPTTTVPARHSTGPSRLGPEVIGGLLVAIMAVGGTRTTLARRRRRTGD